MGSGMIIHVIVAASHPLDHIEGFVVTGQEQGFETVFGSRPVDHVLPVSFAVG